MEQQDAFQFMARSLEWWVIGLNRIRTEMFLLLAIVNMIQAIVSIVLLSSSDRAIIIVIMIINFIV
jgi:hypothetical protein